MLGLKIRTDNQEPEQISWSGARFLLRTGAYEIEDHFQLQSLNGWLLDSLAAGNSSPSREIAGQENIPCIFRPEILEWIFGVRHGMSGTDLRAD